MANFDWHTYRGNLRWLPGRTIYLTRAGSQAYGTALPTSDLDLRGVAIAPREYYHGFAQKFEQMVQADPDLTVFELRKFLSLAADCNPNVIEILFTDDADHLIETKLGQCLIGGRELFLTQRAKHTFSGYALSQLKRIRLHRRWLLSPPKGQPTRAEYGLPERTVIPSDQLEAAFAAIRKRTDEWSWREMEHVEPALRQSLQDEFNRRLLEITQWQFEEVDDKTWEAAAKGLGFATNFMEVVAAERNYVGAIRDWHHYQEWKRSRNPARAEMEARYGFDGKHGMHLVRLLRMAREILTTGKVLVKRPDAEELLAIRNGAWPYERLVEWAECEDVELRSLPSNLPRIPDMKAIDRMCRDLVERSFG